MFSQGKNNHEKTNGFQNSHHLTKALFTLACEYSRLFPPASPGTRDVLRERDSLLRNVPGGDERGETAVFAFVSTRIKVFLKAHFSSFLQIGRFLL